MEGNTLIHYVVVGELGSSKIVYDFVSDSQSQKNYSAFVNHAMSILKQDAASLGDNK
jgi:hypothetical protein